MNDIYHSCAAVAVAVAATATCGNVVVSIAPHSFQPFHSSKRIFRSVLQCRPLPAVSFIISFLLVPPSFLSSRHLCFAAVVEPEPVFAFSLRRTRRIQVCPPHPEAGAERQAAGLDAPTVDLQKEKNISFVLQSIKTDCSSHLFGTLGHLECPTRRHPREQHLSLRRRRRSPGERRPHASPGPALAPGRGRGQDSRPVHSANVQSVLLAVLTVLLT